MAADRRITPEDRHTPKLKQVAGLIQGLTFREMQEFSGLIAHETPNEGPDTITEALLKVSDKLLAQPASIEKFTASRDASNFR